MLCQNESEGLWVLLVPRSPLSKLFCLCSSPSLHFWYRHCMVRTMQSVGLFSVWFKWKVKNICLRPHLTPCQQALSILWTCCNYTTLTCLVNLTIDWTELASGWWLLHLCVCVSPQTLPAMFVINCWSYCTQINEVTINLANKARVTVLMLSQSVMSASIFLCWMPISPAE